MKRAFAILSLTAMILASCGHKDCNAYKTTKYKRVGAHAPLKPVKLA